MLQKKNTDELNAITDQVVDEVTKLLKNDIYKIILYGSYARGDADNESDIDIMILLNCSKDRVSEYRKQLVKLASSASLKNDVEVSLMLRDRGTFEKNLKILPFYQNVMREGVALYG